MRQVKDWTRAKLDSLSHPIAWPDDSKATAENLKPYLGGWNVYGPEAW